MKYPQVVSMPAAVQDWLDEQLEARGIDAIVYTHYILSLLQRDSLDLPDDLLVVSTKEVGRRGRKRSRNREEYWDVWDLDELKRTAAVECLMSASDQKCGIEKLVDELCIKLKEIQSEGGESSYCLELSEAPVTNTTTSLQDQLQKYHAAFPPLNSKFADSCSSLINVPDTCSAWTGKKILVNSFGKNKLCNKIGPSAGKLPVDSTDENKENNNNPWKEESMKSRIQIKDKARKEVGYGFAWNMAGERNEMEETGNSESTRIFHYNRQNQVNNVEMESEWDSRRLYERQVEEVNLSPIKEVPNTEDDPNVVQLMAKYGIYSSSVEQTQNTSSQENTDDQNLAQLIAKFDHSIEALWNPEYSSVSSDEFSSDENEQELPVDFKQLLSSPSEQCLTVELFNLNSKRNPVNSSFIHCGTNITSSIWSDRPSHENSLDQDDYKMECCHSEEMEEKLSDCHVDDKFTFVLVGENKIVGNKLNLDDNAKKSDEKSYPSYLFKNPNEKLSNDKSNCSWNNYSNFSSFFSSLPWTVNNTFGEITQNSEKKIWQTEDTPPANTGLNDSLNTLNHNREDSSFTEVIPKQNSIGGLRSDYDAKKVESCGHDCHLETKEYEMVKSAEKEEEDLLTSTKTHFRPIRVENVDSNQSTNNNVGRYADGTMFVIPTSLEEVAFKRSESGALYLETDAEAGLKYMEYKEKEMYGNRRHCDDRPSNVRENTHEFIPKFRVRQNEKCCQTEEVEETAASDDEVHTKRSKTCDEFYFPDDDHFAENCVEDRLKYKCNSSYSQTDCTIRPDSLDCTTLKQSFISNCRCDTGQQSQMWPKSSQTPGLGIWEPNGIKNHSWYNIWRASPGAVDDGCECGATSQCQKSSQYCQLREELTMEGEQLMSDLSYMQHLYQDEHEDTKSPAAAAEDMLLYEDTRQLFVKEAKSKDDLETSGENKMASLSSELEAEWKQIERPFNAKAIQKDRKRRHSASQRARNYYSHCHDLADASRLEGITLRPVTL